MQNMLSASGESLSILSLVLNASLLVQLVIAGLLLVSIFSWAVIFSKSVNYQALNAASDRFEEEFWAGGSLDRLYQEWTRRGRDPHGMAGIFAAGFREHARLYEQGNIERPDLIDAVHRSMRVELSREIENLERGLPFLATVGSTSPYIGLFGTVWGIMNSFRAIGVMQQATIAAVAPGIAEALIATAVGLFAAIPAVICYNRFSATSDRLVGRMEVFMEEFLSIVNRQAHRSVPATPAATTAAPVTSAAPATGGMPATGVTAAAMPTPAPVLSGVPPATVGVIAGARPVVDDRPGTGPGTPEPISPSSPSAPSTPAGLPPAMNIAPKP